MSLEDKIKRAALAAAQDATMTERGRCLWVLDDLIKQLEADVERKLLMEQQRHTAQVKLQLAKGIVAAANRGIVSGARPPKATPPSEKGPTLSEEPPNGG